ncbi:hypothetical protein RND81_05G057700 [Saponaria officinalis]|uniref:Uncharacterized protein n=1 Tax=Saponaria officinalis TaxID=3572 RepID=A0AAW1KUI9_SAPOF
MGNKYPDSQKDDDALPISDCKEWTLAKDEKPGRTIVLKLIQSETCEKSFHELFVKQSRPLGIRIPKQLVSLDEKYLKQCFERIVSTNLSSLDMGFLSDNTSFGNLNSCDVPKFAVEYPMTVGVEEFVLSSVDDGIVGSITGGNNTMNILSSPLFRKLGISDHDTRLIGTKSFENKRRVSSDYKGSPGRLTLSPRKPVKETLAFRNNVYKNNFVQKNPVSDLSSSLVPDQSPGSNFCKGMLQCTWDDGIPCFEFSLDGHKEVYVANAAKAEVTREKVLDYVYSFHVKASGRKSSDISGIESDLIGKMKVSTTFSLCAGNLKLVETEFVLVGTSDNCAREIHPFTRNSRSRKLSKVMEMFKTGPSHNKQRSYSVFGGSRAIPEEFSVDRNLESKPELLENEFLPNLELAAVVVKDRLQNEDQQEEVGGWGLKFLEKFRVKPTVDSSECCRSNVRNCSTSIDILVPAGPHGGPITRNGGPSSLVERWRSSGRCDCGGWDIGCPLKVLKARPRNEDGFPNSASHGDCKSFDIFPEGLDQITPTLKMANISKGLYFISFQSSVLSALQCFAIAVATIHSKSPTLRHN